jgi:hypothetical protein
MKRREFIAGILKPPIRPVVSTDDFGYCNLHRSRSGLIDGYR